MTPSTTARLFAAICTVLATPLTWAHDGHGLDGFSHWHSTDAWGFVVMGVLGAAMWFGGRK
jgi:hypothetical protein